MAIKITQHGDQELVDCAREDMTVMPDAKLLATLGGSFQIIRVSPQVFMATRNEDVDFRFGPNAWATFVTGKSTSTTINGPIVLLTHFEMYGVGDDRLDLFAKDIQDLRAFIIADLTVEMQGYKVPLTPYTPDTIPAGSATQSIMTDIAS